MQIKNWDISANVNHDLSPALWAFHFARHRARKLGLPWKVGVKVTSHRSHGRGYCGRAWPHGPGKGRILIRLADQLPPHTHRYPRFQNMPEFELAGGAESIVYIFAHECGHIIGWDGNKTGEIACCKFGYEAVVAWREHVNASPLAVVDTPDGLAEIRETCGLDLAKTRRESGA